MRILETPAAPPRISSHCPLHLNGTFPIFGAGLGGLGGAGVTVQLPVVTSIEQQFGRKFIHVDKWISLKRDITVISLLVVAAVAPCCGEVFTVWWAGLPVLECHVAVWHTGRPPPGCHNPPTVGRAGGHSCAPVLTLPHWPARLLAVMTRVRLTPGQHSGLLALLAWLVSWAAVHLARCYPRPGPARQAVRPPARRHCRTQKCRTSEFLAVSRSASDAGAASQHFPRPAAPRNLPHSTQTCKFFTSLNQINFVAKRFHPFIILMTN